MGVSINDNSTFFVDSLEKTEPRRTTYYFQTFMLLWREYGFHILFSGFFKKLDVSLFLCLWLVQQTIILSLTNIIKKW